MKGSRELSKHVRRTILRHRPQGLVKSSDLELVTVEPPKLSSEGQVLVRNDLISIDPTQRIWMSDQPQYMPPLQIGDTVRALTVGQVVESTSSRVPKDSWVLGMGGVQDMYVASEKAVGMLSEQVPLTAHISVCSMLIGLTAWIGMLDIIKPKAGETVVVSGAAGAVGSIAGQLGKELTGCRVIGLCGSEEKKSWLLEDAGFDGVINYKTEDVASRLKELAPDGVNGYFDNTGGPCTEAVFNQASMYARVALCGLISAYNADGWGPSNFSMILHRRMNVQGFITGDTGTERMPFSSFATVQPKLVELVQQDRIAYREDIRHGLENYVDTLNALFHGENQGKLILDIS